MYETAIPRAAPVPRPPLFVGSDIFRARTHAHGVGHPLAIPRVALVIDLCRALGWLPDSAYRDSPQASPAELERFHDPAYVAAVARAEATQAVTETDRHRHNLGVNGHPVYAEMFRRPATACGAALLAARLLAQPGVVYSPASGTHHGRRDRASGFCTFNDPVLAILAFLDQGLRRVLYLDLDAHFGDGVQAAFEDEARVVTVSIHEAGRWPMARGSALGTGLGEVGDRGGGRALNLPVPAGFNDSELDYLIEAVVVPLVAAVRPEVIVVQGGCDALDDDPMTKLSLSNGALWRAVAAVRPLAPRLLVTGGGGYNPFAVGRCWAGVWATLAGNEVPERLPAAAESVLRAVTWRHRRGRTPKTAWLTTLADPPHAGAVRDEIRALARAARIDRDSGTKRDR